MEGATKRRAITVAICSLSNRPTSLPGLASLPVLVSYSVVVVWGKFPGAIGRPQQLSPAIPLKAAMNALHDHQEVKAKMNALHDHHESKSNRLLAALPIAEYRRIAPHLDNIPVAFGELLFEASQPIKHVYFPNDSLVSLLTVIDHHFALEVGMVGREGMVGVELSLGVSVGPVRAMVQGAGTAMRMKSVTFRKLLPQCPSLQRALNLYIHQFLMQISQTAACNRFHHVEQRLARWLLMTRDRVGADHFQLTHEFLGNMLGVRRVGVTKAAHSLKLRKLISYTRGSIVITDGRGLEAVACSCYETLRHMAD